MKVIGIVGMPGSGKSEAADVARSMSIPVVNMGDVIRKEVSDSGLEIRPETLRSMMVRLRKKFGKGIVAERCLPLIRSLGSHRIVVVDGLRSMEEVEVFHREFPNFKIIAIHSSPKTRHGRLMERHRSDDPKTWQEFAERDKLELSIGIGEVIALADVVVSNEGIQVGFREEVKKSISKVAIDD
nr:AAA family ATPase [Candidatus Njordarchaeum guaymaensis]